MRLPLGLRRALAVLLSIAVVTPVAMTRAAPDQADLETARDRLFELEKDFQLVSEEYNLVREDLVAIQAEMAETRLVVRAIEGRMAVKQASAVSVATELYKAGYAEMALESVLSAESLTEIEARLMYLKSTQTAQAKVFERLAVDQTLLEHNLDLLDVDRVKAIAAEARLSDLREEIEGKVENQKDEVADLNAAIERARRRAAAAAAAAAVTEPGIPLEPINIKPAPAPNERAQVAVDAALSQIGKPYQWGAAGPDSYDCSGLTMWAWAQAGVGLPHNSGAQYSATVRVAREDLASGDLVFFGNPIHHVGMYIGNGQMVEAPYSGQRVRVVSMNRSDYVGAGRPGV
ncbi:MAG TPA: NlpC/P60 family protein [Actinomycetota bacterium]|nr:NlpC/P60 family protein [Actinomycetota bacterium]